MSLVHTKDQGLFGALRRQKNILLAMILRNIRTRFFGNILGYGVTVGWPLSHILVLVAIFSFTGRAAPFGESAVLFVSTGCVPFMVFSYLARFMMMDLISTKPLLALPEVSAMDSMLASAMLHTVTTGLVIIVMLLLGLIFGIPIMPHDLPEAFAAMGAAFLMGYGMGFLNGVILMITPGWMTPWILISIVLWVSSGVMFVPGSVPEPYRTMLSYNPMLQVVEWMRSAYYEGYGEHLLDRGYAIGFGITTLALALVMERTLRKYIMRW